MEHLINWIVALNRSHHTGFAMLTVLTMVGFGVFIACLIELGFMAIGIRPDKPEMHHKKIGTTSQESNLSRKGD